MQAFHDLGPGGQVGKEQLRTSRGGKSTLRKGVTGIAGAALVPLLRAAMQSFSDAPTPLTQKMHELGSQQRTAAEAKLIPTKSE